MCTKLRTGYVKGWRKDHGGGEINWEGRVELRYYCKEQCQEHRHGGMHKLEKKE